jgi:hypothetical protein
MRKQLSAPVSFDCHRHRINSDLLRFSLQQLDVER